MDSLPAYRQLRRCRADPTPFPRMLAAVQVIAGGAVAVVAAWPAPDALRSALSGPVLPENRGVSDPKPKNQCTDFVCPPTGTDASKPIAFHPGGAGRADIVTKSRAHEGSKNVPGP
jgi:hypothetical protein